MAHAAGPGKVQYEIERIATSEVLAYVDLHGIENPILRDDLDYYIGEMDEAFVEYHVPRKGKPKQE